MSDKLDDLNQRISELTQTVKEHNENGDKATLDMEALKAELTGMIDEQVALKLEESESRKPVRKGEIVGPDGFQVASKGVVERGKFAGHRVDDAIFTYNFLRRAAELAGTGGKVRPPSKDLQDIVEKALTATGAGVGDEFVPTGMAAELWQDFFLASRLVASVGRVPMPTDPFDMPLGWGQVTWRKGTQNTATTVSDPATAKSTLTSTEQVAEINWSYDLDEDAVIAVLPTLRAELARDGAEQMDRFLLNADSTNLATGNINLNDADPADDSYYLSNGQDGIRHQYLVDNTGQSTDINAALTDALLRAGIARADKFAADVGNMRMATDIETYLNGMLGLTNVVTADKFGAGATVLTGQLAAYQGIPVIVTGAMLEAGDDGKQVQAAASNDEGQIAIYHTDMWRVGFRRDLLIEVDRDIQKRMFIMVVSFRIAVAARGPRATVKHTAGVHGIVRA